MQDTMRTEIKKRIAPERIPGVYRDTGAGIYLRLMTREDTDRIVAWRNSDAVRKNFIYQALFTRESHENWIRTHVETGDVVQMIICDLANDKPLGSVYIRDIDRHHNKAEYGIFIGEADARGSYEKAGFRREGLLRDDVCIEGDYRDIVWMAAVNSGNDQENEE